MKPDLTRIDELKKIAGRVRVEIIRNVHSAQGGHPSGSLSVAELLTALYFRILRIDPQNPLWEDRDRFVLSKGHASIALYAVLAERGYFQIEELTTFDAIDSRMQAHPDMKVTPGIRDTSSRPSTASLISSSVGLCDGLEEAPERALIRDKRGV